VNEQNKTGAAASVHDVTKAAPVQNGVDIGRDFQEWLLEQASALHERRVASLDGQNLAEELEATARKDRTALRSHMQNLLSHLLKWAYQPEYRTSSWIAAINASRDSIHDLIEESSSLRNVMERVFAESRAYARAVRDAVVDTGNRVQFPPQSPWPLDKVLESGFLPD